MAAELIRAWDPLQPHRVRLPAFAGAASALEELRHGLAQTHLNGNVVLEADDWLLRLPELRSLGEQLERAGLRLVGLWSRRRETQVAASALGLVVDWPCGLPLPEPAPPAAKAVEEEALTIHRGTLRSGDHLQGKGTVLVLGDVNPGARVSAEGDVLVWGRLRGVAHAGRGGNRDRCIVALQLRALQLRIADAVARGPETLPPAGVAEEARLIDGEIRIEPAAPAWPPARAEQTIGSRADGSPGIPASWA